MNFLKSIEPSANEVEVLYSIQDAAEAVNVKPSTISKYCTSLDKQGYQFEKKPDGNRKLREQEIAIFRKIGELKNETTVEKAIETIVLAWKKDLHIETLEKPAEVTTEQILDMFQQIMNGMQQIHTRIDTVENNMNEIKEQQLQISGPSEQILAIGSSIANQNNNISEVKEIVKTVQEVVVEQTKIIQTNTDVMKEVEKKTSGQETSISQAVKEIVVSELQLHKEDNNHSIERIEELNQNANKTIGSIPTIVKDIVSKEMQIHKHERVCEAKSTNT